jgi:hypothetical protein
MTSEAEAQRRSSEWFNRIFPGKREGGTFVLDFINDPQDILDAFKH